jgi:peptide-methionine (S)-S-oxide reductase
MKATLGGGCFWCLEAAFQLIEGVDMVVPGYAGGASLNPTYDTIHSQDSGHAEVVQITFNENIVAYKDILDIFWVIHNPTTLNRQGNDVGPEYRSIILYHDEDQKQQALRSIDDVQKLWKDPVVTELKELDIFYEAESEHHNYFKKHPSQAYCQVVINPKLEKLRVNFSEKLK